MEPNNSQISGDMKQRKVSLPSHRPAQSKICINELRENFRRQLSLPKEQDILPIYDPLEKALKSKDVIRKQTGVVYDEKMAEHCCLWDPEHPESPGRLLTVIERCKQYGYLEQCETLPPRPASEDEILTLHDESLLGILKATSGEKDAASLEKLSSNYEDVYIHPKTYECALLSAGCTIDLVTAVAEGRLQNGMCLVRPPGHHASKDAFCGYCLFNNAALAAKKAVDELNIKRVLIVDWDVHHGQATQRMFYDDPRVLYFSFHRYQNGSYWPNLRESDFDFIGIGQGLGFNVNVPLNEIGLKNEDYLAVFHQVLLPIAYQFSPELVVISSGYDAALGCPEGEMRLSPSVYAHFISMLSSLAGGKVAVVLEGGYCLDSLAEGAALTLRALLGAPCPNLVDSLSEPHPSLQKTIQDLVSVLRNHWKCLAVLDPLGPTRIPPPLESPPEKEIVESPFQTVGGHQVNSPSEIAALQKELDRLKAGTPLQSPPHRVCLVYDPLMEKHTNEFKRDFPERPQRTIQIMEQLRAFGILDRIHRLKSREALPGEVELVHEKEAVSLVSNASRCGAKERRKLQQSYDSVYFHEHTSKAAFLAAGCLLQVVDSVCEGQSRSGVAVIRPPGHHAESDEPCGFCLFNNVAIAASYALQKHSLKKILIVDWDIHHGNGTQHIFEQNSSVLYISLHLYKNADFFPYSSDADMDCVGLGEGRGFNVNIPWSKCGVGDADYIFAFLQIVLPIAYQFAPDLVLVSAGFDAAVNDPLGGCRVTPECFGHLTSLLSSLSCGRLILALEGGYNLHSTSLSLTMCTKALLGDPLPPLSHPLVPSSAAVSVIEAVRQIQSPFWSCLCAQVISRNIPEVITTLVDDADEDDPDLNFVTPPESPLPPYSQDEEQGTKETAEETQNELVEQLASMSLKDDPPAQEIPHSEGTVLSSTDDTMELEGAVGGTAADAAPASSNVFALSLMMEDGMFSVVPLDWCPHLDHVSAVPPTGIDVTAKCQMCFEVSENWICLTCYQVYCGRFVREHMIEHGCSSGHAMVLSFSDLSFWCYHCESYVDNKILQEAKHAAYLSKFGEAPPDL